MPFNYCINLEGFLFNVSKIDVIEFDLRTIKKSKLERCNSEDPTLLIIMKFTFLMNKLLKGKKW